MDRFNFLLKKYSNEIKSGICETKEIVNHFRNKYDLLPIDKQDEEYKSYYKNIAYTALNEYKIPLSNQRITILKIKNNSKSKNLSKHFSNNHTNDFILSFDEISGCFLSNSFILASEFVVYRNISSTDLKTNSLNLYQYLVHKEELEKSNSNILLFNIKNLLLKLKFSFNNFTN